jgi:GWxTD domain-containing protein
VKLSSSDFLYTRNANENAYTSRVSIKGYLFESTEKAKPVDLFERIFSDTLAGTEDYVFTREFAFSAPPGAEYYLLVELSDLKRRRSKESMIKISKLHPYTAGFFQFRDDNDRFAPFHLKSGKEYDLYYKDSMDLNIKMIHYEPSDGIPAVPYVTVTNDTGRSLLKKLGDQKVQLEKGSANAVFDNEGLYYFHVRLRPDQGFRVFVTEDDFPYLSEPHQMLYPLRYICSLQEYEDLFELGDDRLALERFWMRSAGNPDRGREMMERYNKKVEMANMLFSTYKPGWKTDRGMVYIIYGAPEGVFRYDNKEVWHYNQTMTQPELNFTFMKKNHEIAGEYFVLERSTSYRNSWNMAVSVWRR